MLSLCCETPLQTTMKASIAVKVSAELKAGVEVLESTEREALKSSLSGLGMRFSPVARLPYTLSPLGEVTIHVSKSTVSQ